MTGHYITDCTLGKISPLCTTMCTWWPEKKDGLKEELTMEQPSSISGGGLRYSLSPTHNAVLSSLPRQLNNHSHLGSPNLSNPHEGSTTHAGPDDCETRSYETLCWSVLKDSVRTLQHRVSNPATPLQLVRTKEASWMRAEKSFKFWSFWFYGVCNPGSQRNPA